MFAAMLVLFSCVNLGPAASACSHLENGIQLYFFPFFSSLPLSPWWWWNWSTNICLSWSNTFLYRAESSLFIQLSYCSVHLETQEKLQGQSSGKQKLYQAWPVNSPSTRQSLGSGEECEEQKSLKQPWPCLRPAAQKAAVWLLLTNICAGPALSKRARGTRVCFSLEDADEI